MRDCSCVDYVRKRGVKMKAVVFSLGCKVNTYEGQAIISFLEANGIQATDKPCYADAYIINTCSVTAEADKKRNAFDLDRLIRRRRRPGPDEVCEVFQVDEPIPLTDEDEDEDILNYDDVDDPDAF